MSVPRGAVEVFRGNWKETWIGIAVDSDQKALYIVGHEWELGTKRVDVRHYNVLQSLPLEKRDDDLWWEINRVPELASMPPGLLPLCISYIGPLTLDSNRTHMESLIKRAKTSTVSNMMVRRSLGNVMDIWILMNHTRRSRLARLQVTERLIPPHPQEALFVRNLQLLSNECLIHDHGDNGAYLLHKSAEIISICGGAHVFCSVEAKRFHDRILSLLDQVTNRYIKATSFLVREYPHAALVAVLSDQRDDPIRIVKCTVSPFQLDEIVTLPSSAHFITATADWLFWSDHVFVSPSMKCPSLYGFSLSRFFRL